MVVLAASVVTKGGKPLLSRQFLGLPRSRLESLLSSFPRLVSPTSEHTVLEASGVRFVYTPLEDLYVLLITNTQSNILLDLATLALATRIVTELASGGRGGAVGEIDVLRVSFEILSAWDEVISLGWRENVNLQQVRSVLEMESHEEKIQEIIARNKEHEAKEELKRRAKQLEIQRREMTRRGQNPYATNSSSSGFSSSQTSYTPPAPSSYTPYEAPVAPSAKPFKGKGMQLGAKGRKNDAGLSEALGGLNVDDDIPLLSHRQPQREEEVVTPVPQASTPVQQKDVNPFGAVEEADVHLVIRETLSLQLNRDGGIDSLELKGDLTLKIADPAKSVLVISLPSPANYTSKVGSNDLQFKTHPNVDKAAWADKGEIKLKGGKKGFPVGQGLGVLKWRMTGKDEGIVPISINCWPSADNGTSTINLEYELEQTDLSLHNAVISVSLPGSAEPVISEAPSTGEYVVAESSLDWSIDEVSEAAGTTTGSMEFTVDTDDVDAFFPVQVNFVSQRTLCGIEILSVINPNEGNESVDYSLDSLLSGEDYAVV